MLYQVPIQNVQKLEKLAKKLRNKGADITCEKVGEPKLVEINNGEGFLSKSYLVQDMEIDGHYQIPGWEFLALIEHTPSGQNVISKVGRDELDLSWYSAEPNCEHCHTNRDRRYTCIVKNTETGELKQVGKSCLHDYTGMDMNLAAEMALFLNNTVREYTDFTGIPTALGPYTFLYKALPYVKEHGYIKDHTAYQIIDEIDTLPSATKEEVEALEEWLQGKLHGYQNEYYLNAYGVLQLPAINSRHYNILASLVFSYYRDLERQRKERENAEKKAQEKQSEYQGQVGEKVSFTVSSSRVLYSKNYHYTRWSSTTTDVLRIVDTNNNIYIWSTSNGYVVEGDQVTATVKEHKEYRGEKQTVITRAKITGNVINNKESVAYVHHSEGEDNEDPLEGVLDIFQ